MKKVMMCLALALALSVNAFALEVPTDTVVQNLNGSQQVIKTFTVAPGTDPQELIEEPFELEGYLYSFADITKVENFADDSKYQTETVTVETAKDDLAMILEQLAPTMEYADGKYSGTLALDHTSLHTEATGYSTKSYTVSETKTIGQLDRNDMSYVPATAVKNGVTLNLANVDWQVAGTDLVGEVLAPSSFQAVATYTGKAYYKAADGYVIAFVRNGADHHCLPLPGSLGCDGHAAMLRVGHGGRIGGRTGGGTTAATATGGGTAATAAGGAGAGPHGVYNCVTGKYRAGRHHAAVIVTY